MASWRLSCQPMQDLRNASPPASKSRDEGKPLPPRNVRNEVQLRLQVDERMDPRIEREPMSEARDVPHGQVERFVNETIVHFQGPVFGNPGPLISQTRIVLANRT
eukprot:7858557-Pyramimonas_sp.AAC.1